MFGALFFFTVAAHADLATDLFQEENWGQCEVECTRMLLENPSQPAIVLLKAVSAIRQGKDAKPKLQQLINNTDTPDEVSDMAHYELARELWRQGTTNNVIQNLTHVFYKTKSRPLFLRAGCSLALFLRQYPEASQGLDNLQLQLSSSRGMWSTEVKTECRMQDTSTSDHTMNPGLWMISFYRAQIRPLLGRRCSLTPSCSEYARQAFQKHWLLGFAIYGDRAIREPSIVQDQSKAVKKRHSLLFSDPLQEHDWWFVLPAKGINTRKPACQPFTKGRP